MKLNPFAEYLDRVRGKLQTTAQTTRKSSGMPIGYLQWRFVLMRPAPSLDCSWNSRFLRRLLLSFRGRDREGSYGNRVRCVQRGQSRVHCDRAFYFFGTGISAA